MPVAFAPLGVGGTRSGEQVAPDDRCRRAHADDGARRGPSGRTGARARLCPVVSDRWVQGVYYGAADPFQPLGAVATPPGHRSRTQAALDAPAAAALCAGRQTVSAPV